MSDRPKPWWNSVTFSRRAALVAAPAIPAALFACKPEAEKIYFKEPKPRPDLIPLDGSGEHESAVFSRGVIVNHDPRVAIYVDWKRLDELCDDPVMQIPTLSNFAVFFHIAAEPLKTEAQRIEFLQKYASNSLNDPRIGEFLYFNPGGGELEWRGVGFSTEGAVEIVSNAHPQEALTSAKFQDNLGFSFSMSIMLGLHQASTTKAKKPSLSNLSLTQREKIAQHLPIQAKVLSPEGFAPLPNLLKK